MSIPIPPVESPLFAGDPKSRVTTPAWRQWFTAIMSAGDGSSGSFFIKTMKSGATQGAAGAAANELWKTSGHGSLPDNVVMIGV